jgi:hypothetical protein
MQRTIEHSLHLGGGTARGSDDRSGGGRKQAHAFGQKGVRTRGATTIEGVVLGKQAFRTRDRAAGATSLRKTF